MRKVSLTGAGDSPPSEFGVDRRHAEDLHKQHTDFYFLHRLDALRISASAMLLCSTGDTAKLKLGAADAIGRRAGWWRLRNPLR